MRKIAFVSIVLGLLTLNLSAQEGVFVDKTPQNRKALFEEFTGLHCPNCPAGHKEAALIEETYPGECFFVNIHAGTLAVPRSKETDLRSAYGETLATRMGVSSIPSVSVNRHLFPGESGLTTSNKNSWWNHVQEALDMSACANIAAKATLNWQSRELSVEVQLYYTAPSATEKNRIHVFLVQDNIVGQQDGSAANPAQVLADGSYLHRHVLRDVLTGINGDEVTTVAEGSMVTRTYTKTLPEIYTNIPVDFLQLQLIAFVTENEDREVINACRAELSFTDGPEYVFAMEDFSPIDHATCNNDIRLAFDLQNYNQQEVNDVTFRFTTPSGRSQEYTAQLGRLAVGGRARIETLPIALDKGGADENLQVQVVAANGKPLSALQEAVSTVVRKDFYVVDEPEITLNVWQDRWGSEISWVFTDQNGQTVAEEDSYTDLNSNGTQKHSHNLTLPHGCNTFVIRDAAKDGINNICGEGHLEILRQDGSRLVSSDGTYADSLVWMLRYSPVSNEEPDFLQSLRMAPNPNNGSFQVELPEAACIEVFSLNGIRLQRLDAPAGVTTLNIAQSGVYVLRFSTQAGTGFRRVVVR